MSNSLFLRGRVDWNCQMLVFISIYGVSSYAEEWIEIFQCLPLYQPGLSLPTRKSGLKYAMYGFNFNPHKSLPTRKSGLKWPCSKLFNTVISLFLRGRVDWNLIFALTALCQPRLFLRGRVDWNSPPTAETTILPVSSYAEEWIEITWTVWLSTSSLGLFLRGRVDWNNIICPICNLFFVSSYAEEWIEIF